MSYKQPIRSRWREAVASFAAALLIASPGVALAQSAGRPPIPTPFPTPDFHFSDPARDARYWRLEAEVHRTLAVFGNSVRSARRAIFPDRASPSTPAQLGSPAWLQARAAVERAIIDRRPARDAILALVAFTTQDRSELSPPEAEYALRVRHVNEDMLRATNASLIDLLAQLAGIRLDQWPT